MDASDIFDDDGYGDWSQAFEAAGAEDKRAQISDVLCSSNESPEGYASTNISGAFAMKDGRFGALRAWCDTTGWDCQSGGEWRDFGTAEEAIAFANEA